ncbi:hypothetical protein VSDG_03975 [Cytospora chrysosperma]|uniref:Uncharacterized protein n=1 Tax=Cytospora chrysosperma TaxID=252740 RepID=A0A423W7X9_CYTCH|nr:hypothetical protein VSDG_03975 [Valsa sordida]
MPFVEEDMDNFVDDVPIPQIGTDLFGGYEDDEEPLDSGPALISETFDAEVEAEVEAEADTPESVASLNNDSDDENQNGTADDLDDFTEMEVDDAPIPASAKKRGRPSLSASRTSTPAKTPKSAKGGPTSAASTGRKRKTLDSAAEPPTKRPGRATAAAAQDAIKEVSKKRHRAPNGSAKPKPAAVTKASAAKKTTAPVKKAAASAKKASPVKAAGRASRRGPGRPKRH